MAGKADIVDKIAGGTDLSKKQAGEALDAALDAITGALASGDKVTLPGFGTFSVSRRDARQGRNPQTGATIRIAASNSARFKAGKGLKDALN